MFTDFLAGIANLVVGAINALIAGLATAINGILSILPSMPALPTPPPALLTAEGWVAWVFPVSTLLDVLAFTLTMFLLWQVVGLILRWAKAINE